MSSSQPQEFPTLYNIQVEWSNGFKIDQTDTNNVRLYNYTGETQNLRLEAIVFGADLAEWYTVTDQSIEAGDMVSLTGTMDEYGVPILDKSNQKSDPDLVGVISTKAGQALGLDGENRRLLALAGRVPVKVDSSSEPIKAGDSITSGATSGRAKKATVGERSIGRALEDWDQNKETVMILVAPGYVHGMDLVADKVSTLEEKVDIMSSLLNAEGISRLADTFSDFKSYADGLGLGTTLNEDGDAVLAVASDFAVTGDTSLGNTTVTGDLNVGGIRLSPVENSLNVLGASCINEALGTKNEMLCEAQTLYVQKSLSGNIDLFDGAIVIEPTGKIIVNDSIQVEEIVIATEGEGNDTVGTVTIRAGTTSESVETAVLTPSSRIFTTPERAVPVGVKMTGEHTFEIVIELQAENLNVDWWLINEQRY
jgi:hypothetical protein